VYNGLIKTGSIKPTTLESKDGKESKTVKEDAKKGDEKPSLNSWHRQGTKTLSVGGKETLNPIESLDHDQAREPGKPLIGADIYETEKARIEKGIDTEYEFLRNFFFMVREIGMTNDVKALVMMFRSQKEKARLGILWAKGEEDAESIIRQFFQPERFL
jgi:hypothetical protein